jgi:hypothetical protein
MESLKAENALRGEKLARLRVSLNSSDAAGRMAEAQLASGCAAVNGGSRLRDRSKVAAAR